MNCFVFYVVVDGVACVPILLFRPWECLSLSLSQVGVLCVGPSVALGSVWRLPPARVFVTVAPCFAHAYVARR